MQKHELTILAAAVTLAIGCGKTAAPKPTGETTASVSAPATNRMACNPSCIDALHANVCGDEGKASRVDCGAQGKRCVNGVCGAQICKPNELHCHEGQLHKCDASGSARKLETDCRAADGVCLDDPQKGGPKCIKSCDKSMDSMVLAFYDCGECDYKDVPFCAQKGPETSCSGSLCKDGELTFAAGMHECERNTDGLIVPGSEKKGACEKGTAAVDYEVCIDGKPEKRKRVEICSGG